MEWALVISLVLGGWQYIRADHHKDAATDAQEQLATAMEVNKNNADIISNLQKSLSYCNAERISQIERINQFTETQRTDHAAIDNLAGLLSGTDWRDCRVPDGVDLEPLFNQQRPDSN